MDLGLLLLIGGALGSFSALTKDGIDSGDNTGSRGNIGNSRDNNRSSRDGFSSSRTGDLNLGQLLRGDLSTNRDGDSSNDFVTNDFVSLLDSLGVDPGSLTGTSSGYLDYNNNVQNPSYKSVWDALSGLISAYTGYDLTNAQRGEMAFNHDEAVLQRQYEMQMSNTAYQRAVKDMSNAGLNPALMYGNGGSGAITPSGASASAAVGGVSSDLLSKILDMVMNKRSLHMQDLMSKRQNNTAVRIAEINADKDIEIAKMQDKRKGQELGQLATYQSGMLYNDWLRVCNEGRLTDTQIDEMKSVIKLNASRMDTEISQQALNYASAKFTKEQARQLADLWPYVLRDRINDSDIKQAESDYMLIKYAFERGLLDDEQFEQAYRASLAEAKLTESQLSLTEFKDHCLHFHGYSAEHPFGMSEEVAHAVFFGVDFLFGILYNVGVSIGFSANDNIGSRKVITGFH